MKKEFRGVCAAMVTPMYPDGRIHYENCAKIVQHLLATGLDGLLVGGATGEFSMMTMEERKELIRVCVEAAKDSDGFIIAGTSCHGTSFTKELTCYAGEVGADFALILPPYYMPTTLQATKEYFYEVADSTAAQLLIYNCPSETGLQLTPETLIELSQHENICGIKNTDSMEHTMRLIALNAHNNGFLIANGLDNLFLSALACGADAMITVGANIVAPQYAEIYRDIQNNDIHSAARKFEKLVPLLELQLLPEEPYPGPVKYCMRRQGLDVGLPRRPLVDASQEMKARLDAAMRQANVL